MFVFLLFVQEYLLLFCDGLVESQSNADLGKTLLEEIEKDKAKPKVCLLALIDGQVCLFDCC